MCKKFRKCIVKSLILAIILWLHRPLKCKFSWNDFMNTCHVMIDGRTCFWKNKYWKMAFWINGPLCTWEPKRLPFSYLNIYDYYNCGVIKNVYYVKFYTQYEVYIFPHYEESIAPSWGWWVGGRIRTYEQEPLSMLSQLGFIEKYLCKIST